MDALGLSPMAHRMKAYVDGLQKRIISEFERLDGGRFEIKEWERPEGVPALTAERAADAHPQAGGGGRMAVIRGARLEKAGVNVSAVHGERNPLTGQPFFATGISLITHCANPHAPTVHMNVRYFEERGPGGKRWFGGGMDLTPMGFPYEEDTRHFHKVCREACDAIDAAYYERFRQWADEYFFIKHRQRVRGVGGVFFDQHHTGDPERDFALVQSVGDRFLDAYLPIAARRMDQPFTEAEKEAQLRARGYYAEFNLAYDRGTRFGFESGGNPEAILVSLPPVVKW